MADLRLEVCVEGVASALAAGAGGADRVELCEALAIGGVTPGAGAVAVACERLAIPVHVLIRPRGGDFGYDRAEFAAMRLDVGEARRRGAAGVVLGLLDADRRIDRRRTADLIAAARPLSVTFHRGFDAARDPFEALDDLLSLGVDRVLTSGGAPTAREGLPTLVELRRRAGDRLIVLPGGGLRADDFGSFRAAGFRELHLGSAAAEDGRTVAAKVRDLIRHARRAGRD